MRLRYVLPKPVKILP